ncbi:hypothetical protein I0Q91_06490 [Halanaerobiaceae bacterium Z-7014]|uniref:Prepilin-type N-terminal cleavage/methylation domain-containing protein n=1 Tax=Halonatronomonas betaini TaxID=2778430 RepID=A0A931ARU6_9FIRM|nr:hypothetical protein [Halonatronomonas betaini]MBF8436716.1 hypothetical protein [Halonatronomonas betaini]
MRKLKQEDGLTLIEVIIALVLLFALVGGFAGAMLVGLQSEAEVSIRMEANNLASGIVEFIKDNGVPDTAGGEDYETIKYNEFVDNSFNDEDLFFNELDQESSYIKIEEDYDGNVGLYRITVELKWQERGEPRTHRLVTLHSEEQNNESEGD